MIKKEILIVLVFMSLTSIIVPENIRKELWYKIGYYIKHWEWVSVEWNEFYIIKD